MNPIEPFGSTQPTVNVPANGDIRRRARFCRDEPGRATAARICGRERVSSILGHQMRAPKQNTFSGVFKRRTVSTHCLSRGIGFALRVQICQLTTSQSPSPSSGDGRPRAVDQLRPLRIETRCVAARGFAGKVGNQLRGRSPQGGAPAPRAAHSFGTSIPGSPRPERSGNAPRPLPDVRRLR